MLPALAGSLTQLATAVGPVVAVEQVVVMKLLPELAVAAVQLATKVGPDVTVSQ